MTSHPEWQNLKVGDITHHSNLIDDHIYYNYPKLPPVIASALCEAISSFRQQWRLRRMHATQSQLLRRAASWIKDLRQEHLASLP
jgi:hypothetical protein